MVEAVLQHRIALPHQRRQGTEVGHVAGGKQQRARPAGEFGQRLLHFMVRGAVADHQVRSASAYAPAFSTGAPGGDHFGVIGQAQVVVAAKSQQRLPIDHHLRPLRALQ
ncbi:hypothetical protein D3C81_1738690 [compost metagenome]